MVDIEALSVAPEVGGRRLGHRLIERASAHYRGLGYRLMMGTFTTSSPFLTAYYRQAGFTVLEPGESIVIYDPLGMVIHHPSAPHVVQGWKALHPDVAVVDTYLPDGTPIKLITEVLVPPDGEPEAVLNDDGTLTLRKDGASHTIKAGTADKMRQMFQTPVTHQEVAAVAEEAARYGIEPVVAARLRKASGYSLRELVGTCSR
ncbi:GNAT family N-acetyltransferase [Streptomyces sp. NPDC002838]|uniref:GNAT family N-acetyltransferase n=1 Tax=Streptomyces sp. NPDC002838 TaxID=3154436 RepID=UPI0033261328